MRSEKRSVSAVTRCHQVTGLGHGLAFHRDLTDPRQGDGAVALHAHVAGQLRHPQHSHFQQITDTHLVGINIVRHAGIPGE